jgi:putative acetyltransferase
MSINIRAEGPPDLAAIRFVNEAAFGEPSEADLVDQLRAGNYALLSLVAEVDAVIAGHIIFSRMWIDGPPQPLAVVALAPVAVLPEHQRHGIGSRLIREGLDLLRARDESIVIVLGHPGYYPRFGFSATLAAQLESPFPGSSFMALELKPGALTGVTGRVRYPEPFGL